MKKLFFIYFLVFTSFSFAKKWNPAYISKLIAAGEIEKVIDYYKGKYFGPNRDPQDAFKIAELYVKKKDYQAAMEWYDKEGQLINTSKVNLFNYANTNRLMGEYQKALDGYLMYAALTGDVNKVMDLANQCEKILRTSVLSYNYKLENYSYNTTEDESNLAVLRTNPVYLRTKSTSNKEESDENQIYQIVRSYENFAPPVKAYLNNLPNLKIISMSFTQDGNTVVFSAREEKSLKKGKEKQEKLYVADNLGGSFLNVKQIPISGDGYSMKNPSFNANGTAIYYSSNQPGGYGGYDIWQIAYSNGIWTTPKNLGSLLNSASDEINPFFVQDGNDNTLYFSSNREGAFGGFDIYAATKSDNVWQDVKMQAAPINSAGDDISIIYDSEIKTGYFSSNRTGGKGGFDIYRFIPFNLKLNVLTKDTFSEKSIDYALVQVIDAGEKIFEGVTDEKGIAEFQINKNKSYTLKISKDGYRPALLKTNSNGKRSGDTVVLEALLKPDSQFSIKKAATNTISLDNFIVFTGRIIDAATNKPATKTKMRMVNYTTQKVREIDVDENGTYELKLLLNNNYKVIFETPENKITDELTTLGLERNSVKVRDYLLSGSKFKLTENKVYKENNWPKNLNIKSEFKKSEIKTVSNTAIVNEKIRKEKVDSLIKIISKDNPKVVSSKKLPEPIKVSSTVKKQDIPKADTLPKQVLPKVAVETKPENTSSKTTENTISNTASNKIEKPVPVAVKQVAEKYEDKNPAISTTPLPKIIENKKEIPATDNATKPAPMNDEFSLAADMVGKKKDKKVRVVAKEYREKETNVEKIIVYDKVPENKVITTPAPVETKVQKIAEPEIKSSTVPVIAETKTQNKVDTEKKVINNQNAEIKNTNPIVLDKTVVKTETRLESKTVAPNVEATPKKSNDEEILPDNYYKIQLSSFEVGNIKFPEFETLGKIEEVKAYERYIYRLGNFESLERAKEILELVRAQGYYVAFILQYNKNKITGIVK